MKLHKSISRVFMGMAAVAAVSAGSAILCTSCSDSFLEPKPLSFFEPDKTFTTESGLQASMAMLDRHLRINFIWYSSLDSDFPIGTDYLFSDLCVYGKTDAGSGKQDDLAKRCTPTTEGAGYLWGAFWTEAYNGVKIANGIISSLPNVTSLSEDKRNEYLGRAYFHRAMKYYSLVMRFGDVPLITKLISSPKENYRSTKKEAILEMLVKDLEFAVEWVPAQKDMTYYGMVNKEACRQLLVKCLLATGRFAEAESQCDELINNSGLALMTEPFGTFVEPGESKTWPVERNVIWDLHRGENKIGSFNKECILGLPNLSEQSFINVLTMRIYGPFWNNGNMLTPDGIKPGVKNPVRANSAYVDSLDWDRAIGRGIATYRPTHFAQHTLWEVNGVEDKDDLRHNSRVGNWVNMEDLRYNNPKSTWHGRHLTLYAPADEGTIKKGQLLCPDTIRSWFDFPNYKIYFKDVDHEANQNASNFRGATKGANANLYCFRLAETYLLRAEARLYQGFAAKAAEDLNVLRRRAHCSQYYGGPVNIGDIVNERARELFFEEFRAQELTRISMILAMTGLPDEWGNTYSKDNWDKQDGTSSDGGSYWYQRIMHYSYYNRGPITSNAQLNYTMDKHNLYWAIPNSAITGNKKGKLHQNFGYTGYDDSVPEWETYQEAIDDESQQ